MYEYAVCACMCECISLSLATSYTDYNCATVECRLPGKEIFPTYMRVHNHDYINSNREKEDSTQPPNASSHTKGIDNKLAVERIVDEKPGNCGYVHA